MIFYIKNLKIMVFVVTKLKLFKSYLSNSSQCVENYNTLSDFIKVITLYNYGMPTGHCQGFSSGTYF